MTEFFGPLVGVMCANDLDHAIELVNQTGYGLTSGLESLDIREQEYWKERIKAGNLYVNRVTTGAVVLRQPFGGMRKSALGAGIKAGGPNYVAQFMDFEETGFPYAGPVQKEHRLLRIANEWKQKLDGGMLSEFETDIRKTFRAIKSYLYNADREFFQEKDYFHLRGQDNIVRYLPVGTVLIRLHENDTLFDTLARIAGVIISKCKPIVSIPPDLENRVTEFLKSTDGRHFLGATPTECHNERDIIKIMPEIQRIRYAGQDRVAQEVFQEAAKTGFYISRTKVMMEWKEELSFCNISWNRQYVTATTGMGTWESAV